MADITILILFQIIFTVSLKSCGAINCGKTSGTVRSRIIGGNEAKAGKWPWMVAINTDITSNQPFGSKKLSLVCGGSIVGSEWVITAAHCLDTHPNFFPKVAPKHWKVTAGMTSRDTTSTEATKWQQRGVRYFAPHPQFRELFGRVYNDFALIRVDKPFVYDSWVRPICLPRNMTPEPNRGLCKAAGWGTVVSGKNFLPLRLQEVQIPIIDFRRCAARYGNNIHQMHHLCGGFWFYGKKDTCWGDSGGPLACQDPYGTWYLAGIISWGIGCGQINRPGIYTNVNSYMTWVIQTVSKQYTTG